MHKPAGTVLTLRSSVLLLLTGALLPAAVGCGQQAGAMMYFLGPQRKEIVKARYTLTKGPLLILFEEAPSVDLPPELHDLVINALIDEFKRLEINTQVVPPAKVNELRRQNEMPIKRGIREVGRLVDAEQVLWIHPREFSMADKLEQTLEPAKLTVMVKVINAKAKSADELRLWPVSEDGEEVGIQISAHDVRKAHSADELLRKIANTFAGEMGRVFHDYDANAENP